MKAVGPCLMDFPRDKIFTSHDMKDELQEKQFSRCVRSYVGSDWTFFESLVILREDKAFPLVTRQFHSWIPMNQTQLLHLMPLPLFLLQHAIESVVIVDLSRDVTSFVQSKLICPVLLFCAPSFIPSLLCLII